MGILEDIEPVVSEIFEECGESVTYAPADLAVAPFPWKAIFSDLGLDKLLDRNVTADSLQCQGLHSGLLSGGVSAPVVKMAGQPGDSILRANLNGETECWEIVGRNWSKEERTWTLTLERNTRLAL